MVPTKAKHIYILFFFKSNFKINETSHLIYNNKSFFSVP